MWWWFLATFLVHLNFTSPQPVINENGGSESNIECCPCPKDEDTVAATRQGAFIPGVGWPDSPRDPFGEDQLADTTGRGPFIRSGVVDDCPCRLRDADSSGAASILFPSAMRAVWPVVSETDKPSKEDPKPLLHPEVDFASSVLETLRQATDEEYEDALARDAARSVMKAADSDLLNVDSALDTAKNIIDVILNPNDLSGSDDGLQEASHVQETRCLHPLESDIVKQQKSNPSISLNDIFATPKQEPLSLLHRNIWDMDSSVEASNVNEQIAGSKNIIEGLSLESNPSLLNLFPKHKNNVLNSNNRFESPNMKTKPLTTVESKPSSDLGKHLEMLSNKFNDPPFDFKFKLGQTKSTMDKNILSDILQKKDIDINPKPLLPDNKFKFTTIEPFSLKNLLKLKDVELIPPAKVNTKELNKVNKPQYSHTFEDSENIGTNLLKSLKSPVESISNILNNRFKFDIKNGIKALKPTNIQSIPNDNASKFKVGDSVTSPSEIKVNSANNSEYIKPYIFGKIPKSMSREINQPAYNNDCKIKDTNSISIKNNFKKFTVIPFKKIASTEILDTEPSASEIYEFDKVDPNEINQSSTFSNQPTQNNVVSGRRIKAQEENFSYEVKSDEIDNDSEEKEDEDRNHDNNSDKVQDNCLENNVEKQNSNSEPSNNEEKNIEPGENQAEVTESCFDTGNIDSKESYIKEDVQNTDVKESDDEVENDNEEEEDDARDHDDSSDKIQENCLENNVDAQNLNIETIDNAAKGIESEDNQTMVPDSFSDTKNNDSNESCSNEDIQHLVMKDEDSLPETSNNVPNIIQSEQKQKETTYSSSHSNNMDSYESCFNEDTNTKKIIKINPLFKKPYKLSSLTENILRRLGDLNKSNKKLSKNKDDSAEVSNKARFLDDHDNESAIITKDSPTDKNQIEVIDLQSMSDKLLHLSSTKDQETTPSVAVECKTDSPVTNLEFNDLKEHTDDTTVTSENHKEMTNNDYIDINKSKETDDLINDDIISELSNVHEEIDTNIINKKELCSESNSDALGNSLLEEKPIMISNKMNEMLVGASDVIENKIKPVKHLTSPFLYYKSPKNGNKETGSDFSKALNLPIFENIRESLPNIFEQPKSNLENFPINLQDNSNEIDTLVEADTPTLKSIFPSLTPSQKVDLDIFQLKPFALGSHQLFPKIPRLNLNSYKFKLALPKPLNWKPMKLTSSLGNKNGLLGATMTIGSDKISRFSKTPTLLGSHLDNLPSLEELRTTLRENAQNLLVTPLETTGRNMIEDTLRSGQTISDNIRSHTKNAVKNIQQTLETTLQDARENDLLGNSARNPQDFLQDVARRHEDFSDKLKGIHYDLNDRLESLRDRIIEQPLLPSFISPSMRQSNVMYKPGRNFNRNKDVFTLPSGKKSNSQFTKKAPAPRTKQQKNKTFKMPAAPSVPVPKTVEAPKLKSITAKSPLLKQSSLKTPQLANRKSISELLREPVSRFQNSKIPVLSRPRENKIKISFSTTPRPDLSMPRNKSILKPPKLNAKSNNHMLKKSNVQNSPTSRPNLKPLYDTSGASSHVSSSKLISPLSISDKSILDTQGERVMSTGGQLSKLKLNKKSNPTFSYSERFVDGDETKLFSFTADKTTPNDGNKFGTSTSKSLHALKNKDILTTLREAVMGRLSNVNLTHKANKHNKPNPVLDMTKSASENIDRVSYVGQSMKENTSYTCRMMCSRNE